MSFNQLQLLSYYYVYCPVRASLSWIPSPSDKTLIIFDSLLSSTKNTTSFYRTNSLLHFKWWFDSPPKRIHANISYKVRSTCIRFSQDFSTFFQNLLLYNHTAYFFQYGQMVTCITEWLLIHSTILSILLTLT